MKVKETCYSDGVSFVVLLVLYTLQGVPMGLSSSIPFLLQSHPSVSYAQQAEFSLVSWPFSLKLLWAPFVDSLYSSRVGRRKSWLVPVQLLCAGLMLFGAESVSLWLQNDTPNVTKLTAFFFLLYLLMATQDIAVDGWALTMLSPQNVHLASTANSVGQTLGYFASYVGFLALHDPATCNQYFRTIPQPQGMVTLSGFLYFWGMVMLLTTLAVWFFKTEREEKDLHVLSVKETYQQVYSVIKLPSVLSLSLILVTCKIGFSAAEAVAPLKLVEYGLPKEKLAFLSPILIPLGVILPLFISSRIDSKKPLKLFLIGYPLRLAIGFCYAGIVYITPIVMAQNEGIHYYYYAFILFSGALHEIAANMMFVSVMSFFSKVSDPAIGGSYMTLLNTISNLGSKWPNSLSLAFVDTLTVRECQSSTEVLSETVKKCATKAAKEACLEAKGTCSITLDGFYVEIAICTIIGVLWLIFFWKRVLKIQELPKKEWGIAKKKVQ